MSRKRRRDFGGCSIQHHEGRLRLRFRRLRADGSTKQEAFATGLLDTKANRAAIERLSQLVAACTRAGKDPRPVLEETRAAWRATDDEPAASVPIASVPTVRDYYRDWYAERQSRVRPAQARDYRRHLTGYVLPALGDRLLVDLKPKDTRGLKAELLSRTSAKTGKPLSEKFVKNIICGSFQAMIRQARADELVLCDPFVGLEWERWEHPEPEPLDPEERNAVLDWFRTHRFSFHAGRGTTHRMLTHPHYHVYLHLLFWHGARPSEASGLQWQDVDLKKGIVHIRRSYHTGAYGKTKTKAATRVVELHPETVALLSALRPLRVVPTAPVFVNTCGRPIEPKHLSEHWHDCLRALGIRARGLYCTKDTAVTVALATGREDVLLWLVNQTGVAVETLRRHYGKWIAKPDRGMWERLDPSVGKRRLAVVA